MPTRVKLCFIMGPTCAGKSTALHQIRNKGGGRVGVVPCSRHKASLRLQDAEAEKFFDDLADGTGA